MGNAFFHLNFLNARGILTHKFIAISRQFSDVKNKGRSQQPSLFGQLVNGEPQRTPTQQTPMLQAHSTWQNVRSEL